MKRIIYPCSLYAALCLSAVWSASAASSIVTFRVDMSTSALDTNTQSVAVRGSFNGWNPYPLTNNPAGPTTMVFSGHTNIPINGDAIASTYTIEPGRTYDTR